MGSQSYHRLVDSWVGRVANASPYALALNLRPNKATAGPRPRLF